MAQFETLNSDGTVTYTLDPDQVKQFEKFVEHECKFTGVPAQFSILFTITHIGLIVMGRCMCGKKTDLTEEGFGE